MKLQVSSWNNGGAVWNAEAEETEIRSYTILHRLNQPAEATVVIADKDGSKLRKYNADANDVYLGAGKFTIEDPDGTDIFYGRLKRPVANTGEKTITLELKDWLDQLDDTKITYDMREKLGTTDLRQSKGRSDVDGDRLVVEDEGAGVYTFYDDGDYDDDGGMGFANDQHNGQNILFTNGIAGTKTWRFHPYDSTATDHDDYTDTVDRVWVNDSPVDVASANNNFTLDYDFHVELGHNTPSDLYVHGSITGARLIVVELLDQLLGGGNHSHLQIDDKTDGWIDLKRLEENDHYTEHTLEIPVDLIDNIVDANGIATVRFDVDFAGGLASIGVRFLALEVDVTTIPYTTRVEINDTFNPNKFRVVDDLTSAAKQMWEGVPYCICRNIYEHMEDVNGLILGGDSIVTLTAGAGDIENTDGISSTQHKNKSRLKMMQLEAVNDRASFWIALGGSTVTYQRTFGAHTQNMSDGTPESWQSVYDYSTMFNSIDIYGGRIGDYEIYQQSTNAASIAKFKIAKSRIITTPGLVSDRDALNIGTRLAARDSEIKQMLGCNIKGLDSTYRLATVVGITSSYLWAAAEKEYCVVSWAYDSANDMTTLMLHPRSSIGFQGINTPDSIMIHLDNTTRRVDEESVVLDPITHEVS